MILSVICPCGALPSHGDDAFDASAGLSMLYNMHGFEVFKMPLAL